MRQRTSNRINRQYVVTQATRESSVSVAELLALYPKADILDELDNSTALVEMPADVCEQISRNHPELLIEPNLPYKLQT
jgi:hypothetical protein